MPATDYPWPLNAVAALVASWRANGTLVGYLGGAGRIAFAGTIEGTPAIPGAYWSIVAASPLENAAPVTLTVEVFTKGDPTDEGNAAAILYELRAPARAVQPVTLDGLKVLVGVEGLTPVDDPEPGVGRWALDLSIEPAREDG